MVVDSSKRGEFSCEWVSHESLGIFPEGARGGIYIKGRVGREREKGERRESGEEVGVAAERMVQFTKTERV